MWIEDDEGNELMEWRKANQIHRWIIDNSEETLEEERTTIISMGKLKELLEIINDIIHLTPKEKMCIRLQNGLDFNVEKAQKLLPTCSGFFYGGTEYDEWYLEQLIETKEFLEKIINNDKLGNLDRKLKYIASW